MAQQVKNKNAGDTGDTGLILGSERSPGEGSGNPFLPGKLHGQRSLAGYSHGVANMMEHTAQLFDRSQVKIKSPDTPHPPPLLHSSPWNFPEGNTLYT